LLIALKEGIGFRVTLLQITLLSTVNFGNLKREQDLQIKFFLPARSSQLRLSAECLKGQETQKG
jgi:hypothetical protein